MMTGMTASASDRATALIDRARTGVAALALAIALLLLFHVQLITTFRASLLVLAALEILLFGRAVLSSASWRRPAIEVLLKLIVLAGAYVALSS